MLTRFKEKLFFQVLTILVFGVIIIGVIFVIKSCL